MSKTDCLLSVLRGMGGALLIVVVVASVIGLVTGVGYLLMLAGVPENIVPLPALLISLVIAGGIIGAAECKNR